jgi:hypothetical protein
MKSKTTHGAEFRQPMRDQSLRFYFRFFSDTHFRFSGPV